MTTNCVAAGCHRVAGYRWKPTGERFCNRHWQRLYKHGSLDIPLKPKVVRIPLPCSVAGCGKLRRSFTTKYCEKHYYRKRRGNAPEIDPSYKYRSLSTAGYMMLCNSTHPLAPKDGRLYEYRRVVYDHLEGVCPDCFWCGITLQWGVAVIDHLNEVKTDNRIENLVVTCNNCNRARGAIKPFVMGLSESKLVQFILTLGYMRAKYTHNGGGQIALHGRVAKYTHNGGGQIALHGRVGYTTSVNRPLPAAVDAP